MELRALTRTVQDQLTAAAAVGDEPTRRAAELLAVSVEPALRLALQDALSQLAGEISAEIAPGRVDLALRGGELEVQVHAPEPPSAPVPPVPPPPPVPPAPPEADGATARVAFRPPQHLKDRLEQAAAAEGLSLNTFLVRALTAHLDGGGSSGTTGPSVRRSHGRTSGWFL
ncbi:histidine kinase [Brachybacterium sp. J144]|uniref:histidine kinase n=1 Tax=Brachybacterium sp. J144 TaxID=3116487 RepID=UPI002E770F90|nr:histidine kinase [Brachybacterium sp. J144]MEE1650091.1 histidine kinase [Brachybacterium sp. J144]